MAIRTSSGSWAFRVRNSLLRDRFCLCCGLARAPVVKRLFYTARVGYRWVAAALAALRAGIEPAEVTQVLSATRRLPVPGEAAGVRVVAIFGRTGSGRVLMVLVRLDPYGFDHLIVGAREPSVAEVAMFEQWEEEKGDERARDHRG
jgi:hypothetical protein